METKDSKGMLSIFASIKNDIFALKMTYGICKSRVIHELLNRFLFYFEWVFFSAFFMRFIINSLDEKKSFQYIITFIIICGILFIGLNVYVNYSENVIYPLTDTKIYHGIYRKLYKKAQNVELACYEDAAFYDKYTMAIDGADVKVVTVVSNILGIVVGLIATCVVFYSMFSIDNIIVLFVLSPIIGNFVFGSIMNKCAYKRYEENIPNTRVMNYVNRVMYLPDYAKELRLTKVFGLMRNHYDKAADENVKVAKKHAFCIAGANFFRVTLTFTFTVIFEGVLLYASYCQIVKRSITLAELTVLTSIMVSATWILIGLFDNVLEIIKGGMFIKNLVDFLAYKEKISESQDGLIPSSEIESIEFCNVSFAYKEKIIINNLSLTIRGGEIVAFVGHNGAGKTTIMKLLFRLYDPTDGYILLNGIDIRKYNLKAYRNLYAAAFQDYMLFGMSVKDNVLMGKHYENEKELVINALKKAGVYEKILGLENGINTIMTKEFDENGAVLSGGESQKLVVARAFAKQSPVKVFDEPSSALDPIAEYELYKNIMKDGIDRTMIFISHRLSSVKHADKVFMLESGRLIEEGNHSELMKLGGEYAAMYKMQAMNYLAVDSVEGVEL